MPNVPITEEVNTESDTVINKTKKQFSQNESTTGIEKGTFVSCNFSSVFSGRLSIPRSGSLSYYTNNNGILERDFMNTSPTISLRHLELNAFISS